MNDVERDPVLLNPGPVNLSDRVRASLLSPDLCHREPEYYELEARIREQLLGVYSLPPADWLALVLAGSGTASVEAMITGLVPPDRGVLVLENGVYGERIRSIAEVYGIPVVSLRLGWGEEVAPEKVDRLLSEHPHLSHVAVVHHETTTGRLNDVGGIAEVARQHDVRLLVDAVSSFGAEEVDLHGWEADACAVSTNKCLHGVTGAAFVVANRQALARTEESPRRSHYLSLHRYADAQGAGSVPFTPAVHPLYALDAALAEFEEGGGWRARHEEYGARAAHVRQELDGMGLERLLEAGPLSCTLTAYYLPDGRTYGELHDALRARGYVIYSGQGRLASEIFRVANMGALTIGDLEGFTATLRDVL